MSLGYKSVQWNPYKRRYDAALGGCVVVFLAASFLTGKLQRTGDRAISDEILLIRAFGTCAMTLLSLTLCIGPAARLNRRFLPLLYNRRHLGVMTFFVALIHAILVVGYYHGFGAISPLVSLLTGNVQYRSLSAFPFEILGAAALLIMLVMAATSHDFWLKNLSPATWKTIHMMVYGAFALVVMHVALGALQTERSIVYPAILLGVVIIVPALHLLAGKREKDLEQRNADCKVTPPATYAIDIGSPLEIQEGRGKVVCIPGGERIAVFRHDGKLSAVSNRCAHQGGPLGEGKIIDGCITCPWHGYQYRPEDGCAPPPFTEKLPTYRLRIEDGRAWIDPTPLPPGTPIEPVNIEEFHHV